MVLRLTWQYSKTTKNKISCGKRKEKLCGSGHTSMYALWRLIKEGRLQVGGSQLVLWVNPASEKPIPRVHQLSASCHSKLNKFLKNH